MTALVTGGAGYIGSHMVHALIDRGEKVVVLDNLSTGIRGLVAEEADFVEGNAGDTELVRKVIPAHKIDVIIHFAGSVIVPESVQYPLAYYANNTMVARNLIEASIQSGVKNFIFSSTATVYAGDGNEMLAENLPTDPISPYGRSKLMTEWMLQDASRAHNFRHVVLRYFNVAGADPRGRTGQSSPNATHLIKRASQVALGRVSHLDIFGTDYPTPDGTGVRDYIHVSDLISAHILALDHLRNDGASATLNCGYGRGISVRDIVKSMERILKRPLPVKEGPRRTGDPAQLVADSRLIREILNWTPVHDNLDEIVRTAYSWESHLNAT